jgi:hypothetical protein
MRKESRAELNESSMGEWRTFVPKAYRAPFEGVRSIPRVPEERHSPASYSSGDFYRWYPTADGFVTERMFGDNANPARAVDLCIVASARKVISAPWNP